MLMSFGNLYRELPPRSANDVGGTPMGGQEAKPPGLFRITCGSSRLG